MLERYGMNRLCAQPTIRQGANVYLRRQRIRQRDREVEFVIIVQLPPREDEELVVIDLRCLGVLYPNPERLGSTMVAIIPDEIGCEKQLYP
jgi:hypothetical protein